MIIRRLMKKSNNEHINDYLISVFQLQTHLIHMSRTILQENQQRQQAIKGQKNYMSTETLQLRNKPI